MGGKLEAREGRFPPLRVEGAELRGIDYRVPVASGQVKSCVLIAGMLAVGQTSVTEPQLSRDHTERILCRARVPFERDGLTVRVSQVDELELHDIEVPGDPSSAAFIAAAACIVPDARVVIQDMGLNWTRTGFFRIAQRMGAVILGELEEEPELTPSEEPIGEVDVAQAPLVGTTVDADEVPLAIDELPLVALLGCFAEGDTVVRGAHELRLKETDRIAAVVDGLSGLGADIEATEDGFVVHGGTGIEGGPIESRGDHRMAMLGAVAGLASRSGVEVVGMDAAAVSYPGFEADVKALAG
jgi:3-phosphoshikimate 1-carboxyvinyltransferase